MVPKIEEVNEPEPKAGISAMTVPVPVDETVISKVVPLFGAT